MKRGATKKDHDAHPANAEAIRKDTYPTYCDFSCKHASFGDPAAVGACRRDIGVWCAAAKRYHNKHARCLFAGER